MNRLSSTGHEIIASAVTMVIVASIAVLLRLSAKRLTKVGLTVDDYWIIFAVISFWVYVGVMLWGMFDGAGGASMRNITDFKLSGYRKFLKALRINVSLFGVSITSAKFSLLYLYYRIFPSPWCRRFAIALTVFCALLLVVLIIGSIFFTCFFTQEYPYRCIKFSLFFLILSLFEVLVDITILCLPLWKISGLQLPLQQKVVLFVTFLIGGLVCITGVVRVAMIYRPGPNFAIIRCILWSNIQLGTAITCASVLTYRPLLSRFILFYGRLFRLAKESQAEPPSMINNGEVEFRFPRSDVSRPNEKPHLESQPPSYSLSPSTSTALNSKI